MLTRGEPDTEDELTDAEHSDVPGHPAIDSQPLTRERQLRWENARHWAAFVIYGA